MDTFTEEGALLVDTYGLRLLLYLTSAPEEALRRRLSGAGALAEQAEAVLPPLILVAKQAAASAQTGAPIRFQLDVLGRFQPSLGTSLGTALRTRAGGDVPLPIPDDGMIRHLALMLRDVFPLMLLPDDPWGAGHIPMTTALFRHPERRRSKPLLQPTPT